MGRLDNAFGDRNLICTCPPIDEYEQHLGKEDLKKLNNILHRKINYDGITLITTTQNKDFLNRLSSVTITLENGRITSLRSFSKKKDNYRNKKRK